MGMYRDSVIGDSTRRVVEVDNYSCRPREVESVAFIDLFCETVHPCNRSRLVASLMEAAAMKGVSFATFDEITKYRIESTNVNQ